MTSHAVDRLAIAVLDGHALDDATLARLVPECRSLTAFRTGADHGDLIGRWQALAPATELIDGGHVADVRAALTECGRRAIVVLATGVPSDAPRFVAQALQGAASMTEFGIPGVAVHVMRPAVRPGSVAWLTDTGSLSGYGVLFAVGYAHLHGTGVDLIEPTGGLDRPRTGEAMEDALAFAERAGVPIARHTDPSPFARVIRDEHCLVVHPVLDAPKGFNLLHPGELSHKAVASGNPAVVVDLLEQFPGDVVAVFDGVHLLSGAIPAARIAAGVALGVVAAAGIGTMAAAPASATTVSQQVQTGVSVIATGHNGMAHPGNFHVVNPLDHAVTMTLTATWVSSGNHPAHHTAVHNVLVQPGQTLDVAIPRPTGIGQGSYHIGSTDGVVTSHHEAMTATEIQGPVKQPPELVITSNLVVPPLAPEAMPPKAEMQVPPLVEQGPTVTAVVENPTVVVETPEQTPILVPQVPNQVAVPNPQVPSPEQKLDAPTLVPPVRGTINEISETSVAGVTTSTVTPDRLVEVGGIVTPATTTDAPSTLLTTTETPGTVSGGTGAVATPINVGQQQTVSHQTATHHASNPGQVTTTAVDGDHAPAGELAHTGGSTAILAIVAGSLIAAGAGIAVAGHLGKDEPDSTVPDA